MIQARGSDRGGQAGFSLIEMAVVTALIAIFLTLGLGALNAQRENTGAATTQKNLETIRDVFINYVRANARLPCPDTDLTTASPPDGQENLTGGICAAAFGVLPYITLGLPRETVLDGWGNFYSYQVSMPTTDGAHDWSKAGVFLSTTGNPGWIKVKDRNAMNPGNFDELTASATAVVVSHGRNGFGAYTTKGSRITPPVTADESENTNFNLADSTSTQSREYIRRTRTDSETASGGVFDDYVLYLRAEDLLGPLIKDGSLTWADIKVSEDFERVKSAVIGYAMAMPNLGSSPAKYYRDSNCTNGDSSQTTPPYCRLLPANLGAVGLSGLKDPLGAAYTFVVGSSLTTGGIGNGIGSANTTACVADGIAFTLQPTGSLTPGLDKTMYCAELRAALGTKIP